MMNADVCVSAGVLRILAAAVVLGAGGLGWPGAAFAQEPEVRPDPLLPPANRPGAERRGFEALVNATVHVGPGLVIENATLVVRDGVIVAVGPSASTPVPAGALTRDAAGLHIYPGLIEAYLEVESPRVDGERAGAHWSARVMPQRNATDGRGVDEGTARQLRGMGFVAAGIVPKGGVFRGSSAVVSLAQESEDSSERKPAVYKASGMQTVAFETVGGDGDVSRWGGYPDSQMGAIALIRQTLSDADYVAGLGAGGAVDAARTTVDLGVNALAPLGKRDGSVAGLMFTVEDELEVLRAAKIAREFARPAVVVTGGTDFRRLEAISEAHAGGKGIGLVVPLNYVEKPRVASLGDAEAVDLRELMMWEQSPTNARRLAQAGVSFAITTSKIKDRGQFPDRLRTAIRHGLTNEQALASLTVEPARLLGVEDQLGTLDAGKRASFVVYDGPMLEKKTKVRETWIDGLRHEVTPAPTKLEGTWDLTVAGAPEAERLLIVDEGNAITVTRGEKQVKATEVSVLGTRLSLAFDHEKLDEAQPGVFTLTGLVTFDTTAATLRGTIVRADGQRAAVSGVRRPASGLVGTWRVFERDGVAINPEEKAGTTIIVTRDGVTLVSEDAEGKKSESKGEKVRVSPKGEPNAGSFERAVEGAPRRSAVVLREGDVLVIRETWEEPAAAGVEGATPTKRESVLRARARAAEKEDDEVKPQVAEVLPGLPLGAYAIKEYPKAERVAIINATVWTSGPAGIIRDGAVLLSDGVIAYVGPGASMPRFGSEYRVIDAQGKHVTPGIIDCHSHTGISKGVNESGQAVTCEVRIADVTNPDAINWYRQLAGGVTSVNNLHGSANAIGGQSQTNKVRWGAVRPDDMHMEAAKPGVKFALGENPKQSNWGDRNVTRYPQTRMGVEAIIRDRFVAGREYAAMWKRFEDGGRQGVPPRRDLELEAMAEILAGTRLIHCHSYRQDEVQMLAQLCAEFGIRIGTYQHNLEGYKVAEFVRQQAIGASLFSDWWGFKVEVQDGIPYAGPIMHEQGVVVSYNSDSDELARRMHVEAAKAHKYSWQKDGTFSVSEEEALKFVTLNPAKQLGVESRVGSLETGKDADVVIWSGSPLSSTSRCEATFVDGRLLFSLEKDKELREQNARERARIVQRLLAGDKKPKDGQKTDKGDKAGEAGGAKTPDSAGETVKKEVVDTPSDKPPRTGDRRGLIAAMVDDSTRLRRELFLDMMRRGINPADHRAGVCGCDEHMGR